MTALMGSRGTGRGGPAHLVGQLGRQVGIPPLPSDHRYRYRQEFLAELYGMTPAEQLGHATGVLSRVWTLRVALNEPARLTAKEAAMAKHWRCRVRVHRWQRLRNPEGGWYRECLECEEQQELKGGGPGGPAPWFG